MVLKTTYSIPKCVVLFWYVEVDKPQEAIDRQARNEWGTLSQEADMGWGLSILTRICLPWSGTWEFGCRSHQIGTLDTIGVFFPFKSIPTEIMAWVETELQDAGCRHLFGIWTLKILSTRSTLDVIFFFFFEVYTSMEPKAMRRTLDGIDGLYSTTTVESGVGMVFFVPTRVAIAYPGLI